MKIQVVTFWVVTPCSLHLQGEDGGSKIFWNAVFIPNHYDAGSEPGKPRLGGYE